MEKLTMPIVNIVPTMRCNLRCKLCSTCAPYYPNPYHPSMEWLHEQADKFFEIVDSVDRFIISGGEVMVRTDLHEWVDYLAKYTDRIGRLEVNSNGTIEPSSQLLESLSAYPGHKRFMVDDYGKDISKRANLIADQFRTVPNAIVELRDYCSDTMYCGGWIDYGVNDLTQIKCKNPEDTVKSWSTCSSPRARYFMSILDGKIYHCARQVFLVEHGIEAAQSEDIVDLFDPSMSRDEIREKIAALYHKKSFFTCQYCNGLHDDAERFRPAQQISRDEQLLYWRKNENEYKI